MFVVSHGAGAGVASHVGTATCGEQRTPVAPAKAPVASKANAILAVWQMGSLALILGSAVMVLRLLVREARPGMAGLAYPLYMAALSGQSWLIMRHYIRLVERANAVKPSGK